MRYSTMIDEFPSPGVYTIEIILDGTRSGLPLKTRKAVPVLKALEITSDQKKIVYPPGSEWAIRGKYILKNNIGYPIQVTEVSPDDNIAGISTFLDKKGLVIDPNGSVEIEIEYSYAGTGLPEDFDVALKLHCRVLGGDMD